MNLMQKVPSSRLVFSIKANKLILIEFKSNIINLNQQKRGLFRGLKLKSVFLFSNPMQKNNV